MVGKNNDYVKNMKKGERYKKYVLRKVSVGLVSVVIGTAVSVLTAEGVQAQEVEATETIDNSQMSEYLPTSEPLDSGITQNEEAGKKVKEEIYKDVPDEPTPVTPNERYNTPDLSRYEKECDTDGLEEELKNVNNLVREAQEKQNEAARAHEETTKILKEEEDKNLSASSYRRKDYNLRRQQYALIHEDYVMNTMAKNAYSNDVNPNSNEYISAPANLNSKIKEVNLHRNLPYTENGLLPQGINLFEVEPSHYSGEKEVVIHHNGEKYKPNKDVILNYIIDYVNEIKELNGIENGSIVKGSNDQEKFSQARAEELLTEFNHNSKLPLDQRVKYQSEETLSLDYFEDHVPMSDQEFAYRLVMNWFSQFQNPLQNHVDRLRLFESIGNVSLGIAEEKTNFGVTKYATILNHYEKDPSIRENYETKEITEPHRNEDPNIYAHNMHIINGSPVLALPKVTFRYINDNPNAVQSLTNEQLEQNEKNLKEYIETLHSKIKEVENQRSELFESMFYSDEEEDSIGIYYELILEPEKRVQATREALLNNQLTKLAFNQATIDLEHALKTKAFIEETYKRVSESSVCAIPDDWGLPGDHDQSTESEEPTDPEEPTEPEEPEKPEEPMEPEEPTEPEKPEEPTEPEKPEEPTDSEEPSDSEEPTEDSDQLSKEDDKASSISDKNAKNQKQGLPDTGAQLSASSFGLALAAMVTGSYFVIGKKKKR